MTHSLQDYGFVPHFAQQVTLAELEQDRVGRISEVQRSTMTVTDGASERPVTLRRNWLELPPEERPTVGDWVVLDSQRTTVERLLERKSLFRRVAAGEKAEVQLIAANIDILFIVTSCNEEFSESRLERFLALAAEAGALPVVVLTKADLADDPDSYVDRVRRVQAGVAVELVNALDAAALGGVAAWIEPGSTVALVGSSGVGKSTLLNSLSGHDIAATGGVRDDDKKGRHTTTHRSLHLLPGGGLLIDVPGIRELKVADIETALASVFEEIDALAEDCRFGDCQHESEPGCAVRAAVDNGDIDPRRLRNYRKLLRENERNTATLAEQRSRDKSLGKLYKRTIAEKQNRRSRE